MPFGLQTTYRIKKKHIQKAYIQTVVDISFFSVQRYPELRIPVQNVATLIQEVLLQQKPVYAAAKPHGSVLLPSRQVFSVEDVPRHKLKVCPEPSVHKLSESVFKNSVYIFYSPNGKENIQHHHVIEPEGHTCLTLLNVFTLLTSNFVQILNFNKNM